MGKLTKPLSLRGQAAIVLALILVLSVMTLTIPGPAWMLSICWFLTGINFGVVGHRIQIHRAGRSALQEK